MTQYKIPQEINVEDKIVGPFTLKGFGFVMAGVVVAVCFMLVFMQAGLSFMPALIIGSFFGSFFWIIGFAPFNGKPLYTYAGSFINFVMKPRQRVWKRMEDKPKLKKPADETAKEEVAESDYVTPKARIEDAESRIEDISLMVDTGGAYGLRQNQQPSRQPEDIFTENDSTELRDTLATARDRVASQNPKTEPTVAEMASVDPEKKFEYTKPDTRGYKIEDKK